MKHTIKKLVALGLSLGMVLSTMSLGALAVEEQPDSNTSVSGVVNSTTTEGGEATDGDGATTEGGEATDGDNATTEGDNATTEGDDVASGGGEASEGDDAASGDSEASGDGEASEDDKAAGAEEVEISELMQAVDASRVDLAAGDITVTAEGYTQGETTVKQTGLTITQTDDTSSAKIILQDGAVVTLDGVNIQATDGSPVSVYGKVSLTLLGENSLQAAEGFAGIYVDKDASLSLNGGDDTASLMAIGNNAADSQSSSGAGIGGQSYEKQGTSGSINITDLADLKVYGYGPHAAGIGSGLNGDSGAISLLRTSISHAQGGFVNTDNDRYADTKFEGGAGIGGGGKSGHCGAILIEDSTVKNVTGGVKAAGIGAGTWSDCDTITIKDSAISNVVGGDSAAGIGLSRVNKTAAGKADVTIVIEKSDVSATGGKYGAAIGTGYNSGSYGNLKDGTLAVSTITLRDSSIHAIGGAAAAAIGGGYKGHNTSISMEGGCEVYAQAGVHSDASSGILYTGAAAIGAGANGSGIFMGGSISIDSSVSLVAISNGGKWAIDLEDTDVSGVTLAYQNRFLVGNEELYNVSGKVYGGEASNRLAYNKNAADAATLINIKGDTVVMNGVRVVLPAGYICAAVQVPSAGSYRTVKSDDASWNYSHYAAEGYDTAASATDLGRASEAMTVGADLRANSYVAVALRERIAAPIPPSTPSRPSRDPVVPPTVVIPEEQPPLAELPDEDVPMAQLPEEELMELPEEEVPLGEAPKTGDPTAVFAALNLISAIGLGGLLLKGKRREDLDA